MAETNLRSNLKDKRLISSLASPCQQGWIDAKMIIMWEDKPFRIIETSCIFNLPLRDHKGNCWPLAFKAIKSFIFCTVSHVSRNSPLEIIW
jgi:hypothetical protein